MDDTRWLLPEGFEELLPAEAAETEHLRRALLDLLATWGYELVIPPFIEFLDSLLIGTGNDLELSTFKLTDQLSGRLLGVRADMTPQVARIDAHHLRRDTPTRLCYLGTVLRTRPEGHGGTRSPLQLGAELYGHAGLESDLEIIKLMVAALRTAGVANIHLDLGHVGIYRNLVRQAGLSDEVEHRLFDALQRKACPELTTLLAELDLPTQHKTQLGLLTDLNGGVEVLELATAHLSHSGGEVGAALAELSAIAQRLTSGLPNVPLHFDLAELRGYHYHTGMLFAAFVPQHGQAVAQGGRYDAIGRAFGRARPATGFSTDLRTLIQLAGNSRPSLHGIFAPCVDDPALEQEIERLRGEGERVIRALPQQQGSAHDMGCDRTMCLRDGRWQAVPAGSH